MLSYIESTSLDLFSNRLLTWNLAIVHSFLVSVRRTSIFFVKSLSPYGFWGAIVDILFGQLSNLVFQVGHSNLHPSSRCFILLRSDGTSEDFSYRKCVVEAATSISPEFGSLVLSLI